MGGALELLADPQAWLAFVTLTVLEVVLSVDNVVFLSILVAPLPREQRERARIGGLALAMVTRVALLFSITRLMALRAPFGTVLGIELSGRGLILLAGGLFLLGKSTVEIHAAVEGAVKSRPPRAARGLAAVVLQIAVIDLVFSVDSVFAAVGMAQQFVIMAAAIVVAILATMFVARSVGELVLRHPTVKMLALAFLILIAIALIAEALDFHIPRGYLYFAMAFSFGVELLNLWRVDRARAGGA